MTPEFLANVNSPLIFNEVTDKNKLAPFLWLTVYIHTCYTVMRADTVRLIADAIRHV